MEIDEIPVGKAEDLKGQKFGKLTVLYRVNRPNTAISGTYWKCQCDCGNTTIVRSGSLKSNRTKSCGCITPDTNKTKALIGKRFNNLVVLELLPKTKKTHQSFYKCQCDCGNTITVSYSDLRNNRIQHCECKINNTYNELDKISVGRANDLTNKTFGRLRVLYRVNPPTPQKHRGTVFWKCQCECGNIVIIRANDLVQNKITSCGCYRKEQAIKAREKPLHSGDKFGKLTVIKRAENNRFNQSQYLCKCECGNTTIITRRALITGATKSCGCLRSLGEETITKILLKHNISFIKEFSFSDCCDRAPLRFDFYIDKKYLLEYDGKQHFYAGFGKESFESTQKHDKIKNEYCKSHNIPLIRIPYWHYDKITIEDLKPETSQFLI